MVKKKNLRSDVVSADASPGGNGIGIEKLRANLLLCRRLRLVLIRLSQSPHNKFPFCCD